MKHQITGRGHGTPAATFNPSHDPGPVPAVVEPETVGNVTTIPVTPRVCLHVTEDIGRTGCTGLTVELASGEHVTTALPPGVVDALVVSLWNATPVHFVPAVHQNTGGVR